MRSDAEIVRDVANKLQNPNHMDSFGYLVALSMEFECALSKLGWSEVENKKLQERVLELESKLDPGKCPCGKPYVLQNGVHKGICLPEPDPEDDEDDDPTPCCHAHAHGGLSTTEKCPEIADND